MIKRMARVTGLAFVLVMLAAGTALAAKGGAGTETLTEHFHDEVLFSFPTENQCTGAPGVLTATAANEVFHITTQADGELWVTGTSEGTVTFTPSAPGVSYSGHFAAWFGEALNQRNHVEHSTNTFVLTGTDGSKAIVHGTSHLSTNAQGRITVQFENERFRCG